MSRERGTPCVTPARASTPRCSTHLGRSALIVGGAAPVSHCPGDRFGTVVLSPRIGAADDWRHSLRCDTPSDPSGIEGGRVDQRPRCTVLALPPRRTTALRAEHRVPFHPRLRVSLEFEGAVRSGTAFALTGCARRPESSSGDPSVGPSVTAAIRAFVPIVDACVESLLRASDASCLRTYAPSRAL